ncbi:MAG: restriction endonuclease subunit M [Parasporobacterium sp.]|nr:restriction endonuclease subunit M [Parasporobacterium sp.]
MNKLIDLTAYPVNKVLKILLEDKTTKRNIVFATDSYESLGRDFSANNHIDMTALLGIDSCEIQPRVSKTLDQQNRRTKVKAEVMTPSWICCKMVNHRDEEWFGRLDVFNKLTDQTWKPKKGKIKFPKGKSWQEYVESRCIEITCGEAPYIVSRYDTTTGEPIKVNNRIGMLDRKLRIVKENTDTEEDWYEWVIRAYQSIYGYEYQGDSLLIARINLLITFLDYHRDKWEKDPTDAQLRKIANIIAWNIWQMDGLTGMVPYAEKEAENVQLDIFSLLNPEEKTLQKESVPAKIYDWKSKESVTYNSIKENR